MNPLLAPDRQAFLWINGHHNVVLDVLLIPVSYAGELSAIWIAICLGLLICGRPADKKLAAAVLIAMFLADQLIGHPLAHAFRRERPYLALEGVRHIGVQWQGNSFPSGHAISVWIAALLLRTRWPRLTTPFVAFALLTLYSRPYLGMHYPLDVVGGSAIGILTAEAVLAAGRLTARRRLRTGAVGASEGH
ncbi:MAG: phosphatase PAP2 family protein [Armatimonadota bacterium]